MCKSKWDSFCKRTQKQLPEKNYDLVQVKNEVHA